MADAVRFYRVEELKKLIKVGAPLNTYNCEGHTPIMVAVLYGFEDLYDILVAQPTCNLTLKSKRGHSLWDLVTLRLGETASITARDALLRIKAKIEARFPISPSATTTSGASETSFVTRRKLMPPSISSRREV